MKAFVRGLAVFGGVWLAASTAHAALSECTLTTDPRIALRAHLDDDSAVSGIQLEEHLAAALSARGFHLCRGAALPTPSVAELDIRLETAEGQVSVLISLSDSVTQKRVERRLELGSIPADSRPLAIAASADELLRASWAELTLVDAPPAALPPPPAVTQAVESSVKPSAPRTAAAEVAVEGTAAAQRYLSDFGARLRVGYWFSRRFGGYFASSTASGLSRSSTHGSVSLDAIGLETGLAYAWVPMTSPLGMDVEGSGRLLRLAFSASPTDAADGHSFSDWSVLASVRLRGWYGSRFVRGTLAVAALYALRPSRAYDEKRIVTSNEGTGIELAAGVSFFF